MSLTGVVDKPLRRLALAALMLGLAGCASVQPETAQVAAQTRTAPVRNITSFSSALRCMDDLFVSYGVRNIVITSAGIPDATGEISTGSREMLITAISNMSVRSNAFRYVDYDIRQEDVALLHQLVDSSGIFVAPNFYIRGAITQLDEGVVDTSVGFGLSIEDIGDFGVNRNQVVSLVTLDMNVVDFVSRQVMPGLSANNSLAVVRTGRAADAGGRIKKAGVFFNIALDQSEGVHQAVRTLVELGSIELLGKLARVPYWNCLQIESTNPAVQAEARNWYHSMPLGERITFIQRALKGAGYYRGPINGSLNAATSDAIAAYQTEHDLIANGRADFQLYLALLGTDRKLAGNSSIADGEQAQAARLQVKARQPVRLTLATDRGAQPVYRPSETLAMAVQVGQNAYVYCYYRDARGNIARIYPNRFQPDPYVAGGQPLPIPAPGAPFSIRFDQPGTQEEVVCFGSERELSLHLPKELKRQDLTPLPVGSMDALITIFRGIDTTGLAVARLPITVQ